MLNNNLDVHIIIKKIKYISYVNINPLDRLTQSSCEIFDFN